MIAERLVTYSEQKVYEKAIEIAKNLLEEAVNIKVIMKTTGLDESTVKQLQKELTV